MGLGDLKLLKDKGHRIYLILILWLVIGFTLFQFEATAIAGFIIFIPLVALSFILFLMALFSFKNLGEMSRKRLIISIIIAIILTILFFNIAIFLFSVLFIISIISYIVITAVFTMYYFYELGVKVDDYLYKLPGSLSKFERRSFFIGGIIISIIALIVASLAGEAITGGTQENVGFNTSVVAYIIIFVIIILSIIGGIQARRRGRLHAWMGIFFVFVAIYTIYLMISIINTMTSEGGGTSSIPTLILLYIFNLFLLLNTIGSLIGDKAQVIKQKLKIFGSDVILMWLIFSVASFQFASSGIEGTAEVGLIRNIIIYVLFIPFLIIIGLYGIYNYKNIVEERETKKEIKQLEKEAKEEGVIKEEEVLCSKCGAVNKEGAVFCAECGEQLS